MIGLMPLLALLHAAPPQDPVAREWTLRRMAVDPAARGELLEAFEEPVWTRRAAALDVCARALEAGIDPGPGPRSAAAGLLADPHESVRERALDVLRAYGADAGSSGGAPGAAPALDGPTASALARDPLPSVRLALARCLERVSVPGAAGLLDSLAGDPDERVVAAALRALCARADEPEVAPVLARRFVAAEGALRLRIATWLTRSEPGPELLDELRGRLDGADADARPWRAVVEALALASGHPGDAELLVEGWLAAAEPDVSYRRVMHAASRSGSEVFARACLHALDRTRPGADVLRHDLAEATIACVGARRTLELARASELTRETLAFLLPPVGRGIDTWEGIDASAWLAPGAEPRLRAALVEALLFTFSRTGDAAAGERLAGVLDDVDPAIALQAFRALCDADPVAPWLPVLHAAWTALPPAARTERLRWLPRGVPLAPFRDELLALGEPGGDSRPTACELLAGLAGDEPVRARLEAWLRQDLGRFEETDRESARARALELAIQGELRALAAVDAERSVAALVRALELSLGGESEIGKVAAAALGRSAPGRAAMSAVAIPDADRRTRVEAAIWLVRDADAARVEAAVRSLIADLEHAAWDLRGRMIGALGRAGTPAALGFLAGLAADESAGFDERVSALAVLVQEAPDAALAPLSRVARGSASLDLRAAAIRLLGKVPGEEARGVLVELFEETEARPATTPAARTEEELLSGELLGALAAAGGLPERLLGSWLRAPLEAAPADLRARFVGADRPAIGFSWAGQLALAASLAREGRLADALERTPAWWRLDGRLLVALGEGAIPGEPGVARRLQGAGIVALLGEREPPPDELARARCRQLGLAWAAGAWEVSARLAASLLADRRAGTISDTVWSASFGIPDREHGVDPDARVRSSLWLARAWAALDRGEPEEARRLLGEAVLRRGASERARVEEERLRAALDG